MIMKLVHRMNRRVNLIRGLHELVMVSYGLCFLPIRPVVFVVDKFQNGCDDYAFDPESRTASFGFCLNLVV